MRLFGVFKNFETAMIRAAKAGESLRKVLEKLGESK